MKYRYKDTDIIVESGIELGSMIFTPVTDTEKSLNEPPAGENAQTKTAKKSPVKKAAAKKAPAKKPTKKKGA